ncbi:hypothetical protein lerEdw1_005271 [Lerista edwardsae]|nr:hypothetical protein lerEdw1_005271 [Lerista edwardsae]
MVLDYPEYNVSTCSPQSLGFPKLFYLSEHCVMTWTERGIYIFIPQNVQVLLWSEVKDIQDIAVYKNEMFCLHSNGKVSHLSLLPVEKCVERLLRRSCWNIAAGVCCLFQNSLILCRVVKTIVQNDICLMAVLKEISKMGRSCDEKESFNVLDSGIYRVISRRGSQSDEDTCSLHSQTFSEDERLKEFHAHQEEEQLELENICHASVVVDTDRNETFLPFNIPLSFRSSSPLVSLQAVKDSVSSFVRKTTEKIGTLHVNPDKIRHDIKDDDEQVPEDTASVIAQPQEEELELQSQPLEEDHLKDLKAATTKTLTKLQDPLVLLQPHCLRKVLLGWIPFLEEAFRFKTPASVSDDGSSKTGIEMTLQSEEYQVFEENFEMNQKSKLVDKDERHVLRPINEDNYVNEPGNTLEENTGSNSNNQIDKTLCRKPAMSETSFNHSLLSPIAQDFQKDLIELTTLCFELNVYECSRVNDAHYVQPEASCALACRFIKVYFFLLDLERLKTCIITYHSDYPKVWETYIEGLKELTLTSPITMALENGDMFKTLKLLVDLGPWDAPILLAHAQRLYEKFGETALRPLIKFYPSILPADIKQICKSNPQHFLAYLDSLIKSKAEDERLSFLGSLLHPESLRLDWLCLAVSNDAPHTTSTVDGQGNPRPHSHLFTWGYNQLILLLLKLPADTVTKQKMSDICKNYGFWPGYLSLCLKLDRRAEALTNIVRLDDMNLLDREHGAIPETVDEWKFLLCLVKNHCSIVLHPPLQNGSSISNGTPNWSNCVTVENVALLLAKVIGPDRALLLLQEYDLMDELSERFAKVCEILRIAEKRQRYVL